MKLIKPVLLTFVAAAVLAHSEDERTDAIFETTPKGATARILGTIPDGTPPPSAAPKPEFPIFEEDVLSTITHEQGGRIITIRKIKPIDLPPQPPPAETTVAEEDAEFSQRLAEFRESHPKNELLFLSATVYRSKDSLPRTFVRWWPQGGKGAITFWSSADFALIAGGIHSFSDTAGKTHSVMVGWSNVDIDRLAELHAAGVREYDPPDVPEFAEGKATFEIAGDRQPNAEELVVIQSLHDIYNNESPRLRAAYEGRERYRIEREEYLKANPPQPKNITLNFWRTETPAPNGKGHSK